VRVALENNICLIRSICEKRLQKMSNLTNEITKAGGITRRFSARNNSSVKSSNRNDAVEQKTITDSIMVAGYLLDLASATVMVFVN
jgi:hypothetical protein